MLFSFQSRNSFCTHFVLPLVLFGSTLFPKSSSPLHAQEKPQKAAPQTTLSTTLPIRDADRVVSAYAYAENYNSGMAGKSYTFGAPVDFNTVNSFHVTGNGCPFIIQDAGVYSIQFGLNIDSTSITMRDDDNRLSPAVMAILINGQKVAKTVMSLTSDRIGRGKMYYTGVGSIILKLTEGDTVGLTVCPESPRDRGKFRVAAIGGYPGDSNRMAFLSVMRVR